MITAPITRGVSRGLSRSILGDNLLNPLAALIKKAFGNGEQGALYVPKPVVNGQQVLFQDYQMTTSVTASGDPVGAMLDLSRGLELGPELSPNTGGPFSEIPSFISTQPDVDISLESGAVRATAKPNSSESRRIEISFPVVNGSLYRVKMPRASNNGIVSASWQNIIRYSGNSEIFTVLATATGNAIIRLYLGTTSTPSAGSWVEVYGFSAKELLGNHATQDVSANRPVYRQLIGSEGIQHWLEFNGSQWLEVDAPIVAGATFLSTSIKNGSSDVSSRFVLDGNSAGRRAIMIDQQFPDSLAAWAGGYVHTGTVDSLPHTTGALFDGSSSRLYFDDAISYAAGAAGSNQHKFGRIGADHLGNRGWVGHIGGIFYLAESPDNSLIRQVMSYLSALSGSVDPTVVSLSARGASTVRVSDGAEVYSYNPNYVGMAASVSKLMSACTVVRLAPDLDATVTIEPDEIVNNDPVYYVQAGDTLTIRELLHCSLLISDNNAATALGRIAGDLIDPANSTLSESLADYLVEANSFAASIGMSVDTNYTSPYTGSYGTAKDQAILMRWLALNMRTIIDIAGKKEFTFSITGDNARQHTVNHSARGQFGSLPGFISGKTGTADFRGSFSFLWGSDGEEYATMVLESDPHTERYNDARKLIGLV